MLAESLAASAGVLIAASIATRRDEGVCDRMGDLAGTGGGEPRAFVRRVLRVAGKAGVRVFVRGGTRVDRMPERLAAWGWGFTIEEVLGMKVVAACAAGLMTVLSPVPLLAPLTAAVGFRAPDLVLARAVRARRHRVDAEIPQLLDLLAAGSSAGLAAPVALRRATKALLGPLAEELRSVIRAVDLGARWRDELRRSAERLDLPDLRRTVASLTRTETLGSSLSESMSELAARVRETRRAEASERARTAPVKMLFPLVFLILPAFLLLTVVPVLLSTINSIR